MQQELFFACDQRFLLKLGGTNIKLWQKQKWIVWYWRAYSAEDFREKNSPQKNCLMFFGTFWRMFSSQPLKSVGGAQDHTGTCCLRSVSLSTLKSFPNSKLVQLSSCFKTDQNVHLSHLKSLGNPSKSTNATLLPAKKSSMKVLLNFHTEASLSTNQP
jgi:hypothetical protein